MSLQGGDMFDAIVTADKYRYTERTASHVMLQLLNAVDYLHSIRIAHRNIRLENILVSLLQLSSSASGKPYNRVSNTSGNPGNLLKISKVSWKFSG